MLKFRQALLREAIECLIGGDLATGKAVLRVYVNATAGFQDLKSVRASGQSLMRMLRPKGSPSAENHCLSSPSCKNGRRAFRLS
ncbi:MAG: hypothetical protein WKF37_23690 [Bryobacteraceae bacterium]